MVGTVLVTGAAAMEGALGGDAPPTVAGCIAPLDGPLEGGGAPEEEGGALVVAPGGHLEVQDQLQVHHVGTKFSDLWQYYQLTA